MKMEFTEDKPLQEGIRKAVSSLKRISVEVGLPSSASSRNHFLLALHERGSPLMHIPPRPVVSPALNKEETRSAISEALSGACEAAAEGDPDGVRDGFTVAGEAGVAAIRAYIDAGISPGNAPITIHGGWIRNFSSGKPVMIPGKGFDKPLYDTGELYNAFDFEVKESG